MARTLWGLIIGLAIALGWSAPSHAQAFHTASEASSACESHKAIYPADKQPVTCKPRQLSGNIVDPATGLAVHGCQYLEWLADGNTGSGFEYPCGSTQAQCLAMPSYPASYGSNISVCNAGCIYKPGADANTDTVHGAGGYFAGATSGQYSPTGQTCGVEVPQPPQATGRLCGGGSCYDAASGNYCAVGSAGQVCIHGPAPGAAGGCVSGGDTTLCAGNPPPLPPNPPVADPSTDIGASDTYGHQSGGGTINNTTVNNYGSGGNAPNNGANSTSGDTAPPKAPTDPAGSSSTSAPKDPTSASGGGDCNTPPVCEGAAATCMVVKQTWLLRCPPGSQGAGQGPGEGDGDTTVPGLDGVAETPGAGFMKSESLLDKLDQGGFMGGGTCPKLLTIDIDMFDVHSDSSSLPWCDILGKVRWLLVMLAAYASYRILSEK